MEIRRLLWLLVCLANFEERLCGNVNLSGKSLTSLPDDIVQNVTHLYLNVNDITRIRRTDFNDNTTLTILNMDSNEIATIAVEELSYLIKLTGLYLSNNRLTTLPGIAQFMPSLNELFLEGNPLDCCCSDIWVNLRDCALVCTHVDTQGESNPSSLD
ncbi:hypothetical protein CAPTEDRAFT_100948 [Capitella teleta]|uniref:LRRCT domain-containing protein n=1 Tax=Capitella teleta TaxID=283909 RepID=R7VAM5_CAPTE|nr:hypothetical protein CAPTEDRAFT_100948 [Capitella teleta]|eukprot:ELU12740.1 hypothetical protein CAPTEDRAFT_100948 [Capitella teleta]